MAEVTKRQKETNKSLKQVVQTEDHNIKDRKDDIADLNNKLNKLTME